MGALTGVCPSLGVYARMMLVGTLVRGSGRIVVVGLVLLDGLDYLLDS